MESSLINAIRAAESFSSTEGSVVIISAISADLMERWFIVEGVRKAYRRIYVVDMHNHKVTEIIGGSNMSKFQLINAALESYEVYN